MFHSTNPATYLQWIHCQTKQSKLTAGYTCYHDQQCLQQTASDSLDETEVGEFSHFRPANQ